MWRTIGLVVLLAGCSAPGDDAGNPARADVATRVVTLAPHLAELTVAAGAGDALVGVSSYTDYPQTVTDLPVIGDAFVVDQEQLALLRPDLLLAWSSGTPAHVVDELRVRGYRVEVIRTRGLDDVADAIEKIGELTGRQASAAPAADEFRRQLAALRERWSGAETLRVFYQVSSRPLYTVNGDHYVSELIELCGGENIFAALGDLAPMVTEEAVLERNPDVLLTADADGDTPFRVWQRWPTLNANRYNNHFVVPAAEIGRASPRLLLAGRAVCERLARGRAQRAAHVE